MTNHRSFAVLTAGAALLLSACTKTPPGAPEIVAGPAHGIVNTSYDFTATAISVDDSLLAIQFDWGDGDTSEWSEIVPSGDSVTMSHAWAVGCYYDVRARARGESGRLSEWSAACRVPMSAVWVRTNGGAEPDWGEDVWQTSDGGYVVAGFTESYGSGENDAFIIKLDAVGDTEWTRTVGGDRDDWGRAVQQTADGGYIIAGTTESFGAGDWDMWLIKLDAAGGVVWTRTFGHSDKDRATSVLQAADGGYIVTGYGRAEGSTHSDVRLVKTTAAGDILWAKTYGGTLGDYAWCIGHASDGGYVVAGFAQSAESGGDDIYLLRVDAAGDTIWTNTYGVSGSNEVAYSVQQCADGGYIMAGYKYTYSTSERDIYLVKADAHGNLSWARTIGERGEAHSVEQVADGTYIVVGLGVASGSEGGIVLIKTGDTGDTIWTKTYPSEAAQDANAAVATEDGGYILAGLIWYQGAGAADVYLIKTDAMGNVGP